MPSLDKPAELCLRLAAVTALLGGGWLIISNGLALRAIVWDEAAFGYFPRLLNFSWKEWVTSATVDRAISLTETIIGILYLLFAGLLAWRTDFLRARVALDTILVALLVLRPLLFWKEHFWQLGALLELGVQTMAPLFYVCYCRFRPGGDSYGGGQLFWWGVSAMVAFTFIGHGLYAVGFYPLPAHFVFMTQSGLGVEEDLARSLLFGVGILDFLAAGLLLLPWPKAWLPALLWVIPWAALTTLARLWSYGGLVDYDVLLIQWFPEMIVRLSHVLVPLALFLWVRARAARGGGAA